MVSKEAKIGLLLGLVFIVAIAVVLRGVHQNTTSELGQLAANGDIEASTGEMTHEALDIAGATQQLTDPWNPASGNNKETSPKEDKPLESGAEAPMEFKANKQEEGDNVPLLPAGRTRYVEDLFGSGFSTPKENTIARIGEQAPSTGSRSYVVQAGDSLWKIAARELGRGERCIEIQEINNLPDNYPLRIGQELKLPGGQRVRSTGPDRESAVPAVEGGDIYVVREGDSLWKIAQSQLGEGLRYTELARLNNLTESSTLRLGQRLKLPATRGNRAGVNSEITILAGEKLYVVREGDSLWKIAERELGNGGRYMELADLNNLTENSLLRTGQKLRLPAK